MIYKIIIYINKLFLINIKIGAKNGLLNLNPKYLFHREI